MPFQQPFLLYKDKEVVFLYTYLDYISVLLRNTKGFSLEGKILNEQTVGEVVERLDALHYLDDIMDCKLHIFDKSNFLNELELYYNTLELEIGIEDLTEEYLEEELTLTGEFEDTEPIPLMSLQEDMIEEFNAFMEENFLEDKEPEQIMTEEGNLLTIETILEGREQITVNKYYGLPEEDEELYVADTGEPITLQELLERYTVDIDYRVEEGLVYFTSTEQDQLELEEETEEETDNNIYDENGNLVTEDYINTLGEDEYEIEDGVLYLTDVYTARNTFYTAEDGKMYSQEQLDNDGFEEGFDYTLEGNTITFLLEEDDIEDIEDLEDQMGFEDEEEDIEDDLEYLMGEELFEDDYVEEEYYTEYGEVIYGSDLVGKAEGVDYIIEDDTITFLTPSNDQTSSTEGFDTSDKGLGLGKNGNSTHFSPVPNHTNLGETSSFNAKLDNLFADLENLEEDETDTSDGTNSEELNKHSVRNKSEKSNVLFGSNSGLTFDSLESTIGVNGFNHPNIGARREQTGVQQDKNDQFANFLTSIGGAVFTKPKHVGKKILSFLVVDE